MRSCLIHMQDMHLSFVLRDVLYSIFLLGLAGYLSSPTMPPMMVPPGAPSFPGQLNAIPRPPVSAATTVPGSTAGPTSNGAPPMVTPPLYQASPAPSTSGGYDNLNANAQATEANH
jgi:U1 small nuclear ribonucleoprotein C